MSVASHRSFTMLAPRGRAGVYPLAVLATPCVPLCGYRRFGLQLQSPTSVFLDTDCRLSAGPCRRSAPLTNAAPGQFLQKQTVPSTNAAATAA